MRLALLIKIRTASSSRFMKMDQNKARTNTKIQMTPRMAEPKKLKNLIRDSIEFEAARGTRELLCLRHQQNGGAAHDENFIPVSLITARNIS